MSVLRLHPVEINRLERAAIRFTRLLSTHALIRASDASAPADRAAWLELARVRARDASQVILRARRSRAVDEGAPPGRSSSERGRRA